MPRRVVRARAPGRARSAALAVVMVAVATTGCGDDPERVASGGPLVPSTPATTPSSAAITSPPVTPPASPSVTPPASPSVTPPASPSATPPASPPGSTRPAAERRGVRLALQAARDRWRVAGIDTYEHTYAVLCACEPTTVTLRVLAERVLGPRPRDPQSVERGVVSDWFDAVGRAIDTADVVEAEFDDELGHPIHVLIDPDGEAPGDEYGLDTTRFTVVREPLSRWFTQSSGCGFELAAATPDQSAAIVLRFADDETDRTRPGMYDAATLHDAALLFGTDVMANHCGVALPGGQGGVVDTVWPVTGGTIGLTFEPRSVAVGDVDGLIATTGTGTALALGSAVLRNPAWGAGGR